jgi:hypothetical protein
MGNFLYSTGGKLLIIAVGLGLGFWLGLQAPLQPAK